MPCVHVYVHVRTYACVCVHVYAWAHMPAILSHLSSVLQEQVDMQAILAGVLSLGNVSFQPQESNGAVQVGEVSRGWLKAAAVSLRVR